MNFSLFPQMGILMGALMLLALVRRWGKQWGGYPQKSQWVLSSKSPHIRQAHELKSSQGSYSCRDTHANLCPLALRYFPLCWLGLTLFLHLELLRMKMASSWNTFSYIILNTSFLSYNSNCLRKLEKQVSVQPPTKENRAILMWVKLI